MEIVETKKSFLEGWRNEAEIKELTGFKTTKLWKLRQENLVVWSRLGRNIYYKEVSFLNLLERNISK